MNKLTFPAGSTQVPEVEEVGGVSTAVNIVTMPVKAFTGSSDVYVDEKTAGWASLAHLATGFLVGDFFGVKRGQNGGSAIIAMPFGK